MATSWTANKRVLSEQDSAALYCFSHGPGERLKSPVIVMWEPDDDNAVSQDVARPWTQGFSVVPSRGLSSSPLGGRTLAIGNLSFIEEGMRGGDQVGPGMIFGHESVNPSFARGSFHLAMRKERKHDYEHRRKAFDQSRSGFEAIHNWHGKIQDDELRNKSHSFFYSFAPVLGITDYFKPGFTFE
jgi:hypothetical protein